MQKRILRILSQIRKRTELVPEVGIVLGTGFDKLAESVEPVEVIPYKELDGMPISTAMGHKGEFIFGYISSRPVVIMRGRLHYYEGYQSSEVVIPIRVMALLGIKTLLLSNAAGGVNPSFSVGDFMIITDHINFIPNPLIGPNIDDFGPRFPGMNEVYSKHLIALAKKEAEALNLNLREGVYVSLTGPSFETPAEYNFVRIIGGSAVGMSTTPEVIVASHMGIRVLAFSMISNVAFSKEEASGEEVLAQSDKNSLKLSTLIGRILASRDF